MGNISWVIFSRLDVMITHNAKKVKSLAMASLIISSVFVFAIAPQPAFSLSFDFNSKINVSNTGSGPTTDEQMSISNNNAYLIWTDQTGDTGGSAGIFFSNSTNNGASFFTPINLSNDAGDSQFPQIAVSTNNHVYAIWQDDTIQGSTLYDIFFTNSTNNGHDFSPVSDLTNGVGISGNSHLTISGDKVFAIWQTLNANNDIFFINGTDSGSGVKFPDPIKNLSNVQSDTATNPQIAVTGNNVYAVWQESDSSGANDIIFTNSTDGGSTFSVPANLTKNSGDSINPKLSVSGNDVYVVWEDDTSNGPGNYDVLFVKGTNTGNGAKFTTPIQNLSNNPGATEDPKVVASGSNVYVVWSGDISGVKDILYERSIDSGVNFNSLTSGAPINLSLNSGISVSPQIAVSGNNVNVAWQDDTANGPNNDVFFKTSIDSGNTFGGFNIVSDIPSSGLPTTPVLATDGNNAYVAWSDDNSGAIAGDVFFRTGTSSASGTDITFDKTQYRLSEQAGLRIIDTGSNTTSVDQIFANVYSTSDPSPSGIQTTLTETTPTSANFTNFIHFHLGSSNSNNDTLKASPGDTITASFAGKTGTAFIYTRTVGFDFSFYTIDKNATITVTDQNSNNPSIIDTITGVTVTSTSDPVGIAFSITEAIADNNGIFSKKIGFANSYTSIPRLMLKANVGDIITVSFLGKSSTATITSGVAPGGGGGGLIRPGLVLDAAGGGYIPSVLLNLIKNLNPSQTIMPSTDKSFDFPFSIEDKGFPLSSYSNKILTNTISTDESVPMSLTFYTPRVIQHVGLYFDIHGNTGELQDSDTYILFDQGQPIQIVDPHGFFSSVDLITSKIGMKNKFNYDIIFAKPMEKSDIITRIWDEQKRSADTKILDAIQVIQSEKKPEKNNEAITSETIQKNNTPIQSENQVDLIPKIKEWGGYSPTSISDSDMLKSIGIEGNHIPDWVMKTTKWVINGDITQKEFLDIIQYLHEKGAVK